MLCHLGPAGVGQPAYDMPDCLSQAEQMLADVAGPLWLATNLVAADFIFMLQPAQQTSPAQTMLLLLSSAALPSDASLGACTKVLRTGSDAPQHCLGLLSSLINNIITISACGPGSPPTTSNHVGLTRHCDAFVQSSLPLSPASHHSVVHA